MEHPVSPDHDDRECVLCGARTDALPQPLTSIQTASNTDYGAYLPPETRKALWGSYERWSIRTCEACAQQLGLYLRAWVRDREAEFRHPKHPDGRKFLDDGAFIPVSDGVHVYYLTEEEWWDYVYDKERHGLTD